MMMFTVKLKDKASRYSYDLSRYFKTSFEAGSPPTLVSLIQGAMMICNDLAMQNHAADGSIIVRQTPNEEAGLAAIVEAFRKGINFYDTAPFYGGGSAEKVSSRSFGSCASAVTMYCHCLGWKNWTQAFESMTSSIGQEPGKHGV
jgi:hypothetical protein